MIKWIGFALAIVSYTIATFRHGTPSWGFWMIAGVCGNILQIIGIFWRK